MKVTFKHIKIENFKNIGLMETDFSDKTIVSGANETGKTTFADAIFYVLTGKSSLGESQFNIIPIGSVGVSPKVELTVEIEDNGEKRTIILAREYKAKQNRTKEFDGTYQTICYVSGLKCGVKEFENWIAEHICGTEIFKLISDAGFFTENITTNGREMGWEAQRRILFNLCMIQSDEELVRSDERYKDIVDGVVNGYGLNNYLRVLKQNENSIENKIEETNRQIEQAKDKGDDSVDVEAISSELDKVKYELNELESKNNEYVKGQEKKNSEFRKKKYSELEKKLNKLESSFVIEKEELERKRKYLTDKISEYSFSIYGFETKVNVEKDNVNEMIKKLDELENSNLIACPTCGQFISTDLLEEKKKEINKKIKKSRKEIEKLEENIRFAMDKMKKAEKERDELFDNIHIEPKEITEVKGKIKELVSRVYNAGSLHNFEADKNRLYGEIAELQEQMGTAIIKIGYANSVNLCKEELKKLVAERANIREKIDLCKELIDKKCDMITDKVNSMFAGVKFEFFEKNKTNDEIRDCCNIYFNGVPYESLSYSTKFFVGLQIALGFQKMCKVSMPVVIDNAESIDIGIDIPVQSIMLVKKQETCPNCGGVKHSRKNEDGTWTCYECGEQFKKTLEILNV